MLARLGRRVRASRGGFGRPQLAPWSAPSALTRRCGFGASAEPAEPSCAYDVLRVAPSATPAEIKTAFRRTARRLHPDAGPPSEADRRTDVFVKAVAAYEILSCERRRALYDAERRWTWDAAKNKNAASPSDAGADPGPRAPWAFILRHSEVLRDYGASVDALVPRGALRREIYAALGDALAGPELDVEAVATGDAFPKFFEAEERSGGLAANLGVDLMHVVSGQTLLAAVRERAGTSAIESRGDEERAALTQKPPSLFFPEAGPRGRDAAVSRRGASPPGCHSSSRRSGFFNGASRVDDMDEQSTQSTQSASPAPPDAVLELTLFGRVVATAVRRERGGEVVVYDAGRADGDASRVSFEASLFEANANNYAGEPSLGPSPYKDAKDGSETGRDDATRDDASPFARARRGPNGEAFVLTGLSGSFDVAAVLDARGEKTHAVVAHATPGVTHLHWFCARSGAATGRATRAWMPPADLWLARPRSEQHAEGGWYFELPPGAPGPPGPRSRRVAPDPAPDRRDLPAERGGSDAGSERGGDVDEGARSERDAFEEVRDDIRAMSDFFSAGALPRDEAKRRAKKRTPVPLPPAAALFATAFRVLDRERGEDQGAAGAARRAWEGVFGKRY
jgi:curved DNA-binding protein CbpA